MDFKKNFKKIKTYLTATAITIPLSLFASGFLNSTPAQTKVNQFDKNKHTITAQNFKQTYSKINAILGTYFTPEDKNPLENLFKVTGWYNSNQNDSLEVFLDKNMYSKSGGNYILPDNEKDKKIFLWADGTPAINFYQVGSGHGKFKNAEAQRDLSTTIANLFEQGDFNGDEKDDFLSENYNLSREDVTEVKKEGSSIDVLTSEKGDFETTNNHEATDGRVYDNHLKLVRNHEYSMPLRNALYVSGVDVNTINTFVDSITAYKGDDLSKLKLDNKGLSQDNESLNEKLGELSTQLSIMAEKYGYASSDLNKANENLSYWSAGPIVTINTNGEIAWGVYSTLPFFGNKVGLGVTYSGQKKENTTFPTSVVSDTKHHPVLPITGHSVETTNGSSTKSGNMLDLILGVNAVGNLSILGGASIQTQNYTSNTSKTSETWFEDNQGTKLDYQRIPNDLSASEKNTIIKPLIGAMYDVGRVKLLFDYKFADKTANLGMGINIGSSSK